MLARGKGGHCDRGKCPSAFDPLLSDDPWKDHGRKRGPEVAAATHPDGRAAKTHVAHDADSDKDKPMGECADPALHKKFTSAFGPMEVEDGSTAPPRGREPAAPAHFDLARDEVRDSPDEDCKGENAVERGQGDGAEPEAMDSPSATAAAEEPMKEEPPQ
eukprot:631960-Pyramimonas_sp.AAC.1